MTDHDSHESEDEGHNSPDPGSTGALVLSTVPDAVDGTHGQVDPHLVAHPPYQRNLSKVWADREGALGWNPALGYGIVVNKVPLKQHLERPGVEVDADAVSYAEQIGSKFLYEVIIGQHRSYMAKILGLTEIPALVLNNVDDDQAALLFVQDARSTRPLRGYDIHVAALTRSEPRAAAIQAALDDRSIQLVPSGLTDGKVSCIRAFEKICGPDVSQPDEDALAWCLDTLLVAFPKVKWPDPIVHGLMLWRKAEIRDGNKLPTSKALGSLVAKPLRKGGGGGFGGDPKAFADKVREVARTTGSASPHVAADVWDTYGRTLRAKTSRYAELDS